MKPKSGFAMIRDGLLEHMFGITPMESKIYLIQHLMANRTGPDRGKVSTSVSELARLAGHKREHVRRAIHGLEEKDYLKPLQGGWLIINFNGDNPARVARKGPCPKTGHGPKRAKKWPEKGQTKSEGWPEKGQKVARKGPDKRRNPHKKQQDKPPVYVDGKKEEDVYGKSSAGAASWKGKNVSWDEYRAGVAWCNDKHEVGLSDLARRGLREHLETIAAEEGLRMLAREELQLGWGRLNTLVLKDARVRGPATLPGLVRNWFMNDLRWYNLRAPPKHLKPDPFKEALRQLEEEKRGEEKRGEEKQIG